MDRNVYREVGPEGATEQPVEPPPHEKLAKFFPEAPLALYVTVDPMLRQAASGQALKLLLWCLLGASVILGVLYLVRVWHVTRKDQIAISMVAFLAYEAAIGGPFTAQWSGYKTLSGGIAAAVLTAFMAFLPAPQRPGGTS